jgi:Short C-terminal domain
MPGLMRGIARTAVVAGTATAVSGRVSRRQQGRWASQQQASAPPAEAPPAEAPPQDAPSPQGGDMDSKLAQLKELGALKEQGVLTEAEFEEQKGRILSS